MEIRRDQYQAFVAGREPPADEARVRNDRAAGRAPKSKTVERELIYERLWGRPMDRNDRSVDVFVHKLRRKLDRASPAGATSTPTSASATAWRPSPATPLQGRCRATRAPSTRLAA